MSQIDDAITALASAKKLLDKLGPLETALETTQQKHEASLLALAATNKELTDAKAGLGAAHIKNLRDYEEAIFNKSQMVNNLDAKIAGLQQKHDTISVEVASKQEQHEQLVASLTAIKAKHFG